MLLWSVSGICPVRCEHPVNSIPVSCPASLRPPGSLITRAGCSRAASQMLAVNLNWYVGSSVTVAQLVTVRSTEQAPTDPAAVQAALSAMPGIVRYIIRQSL